MDMFFLLQVLLLLNMIAFHFNKKFSENLPNSAYMTCSACMLFSLETVAAYIKRSVSPDMIVFCIWRI